MALDRLQPDERARTLAHVDSCASCRAELTMLEHLSRAMTHADATRPRPRARSTPELRDRIMLRLNDERAVVRRLARGDEYGRGLAAVAAVMLLALGVGVMLRDNGDDRPRAVCVRAARHERLVRIASQLDRHVDHLHARRARSARRLLVVAHRCDRQAGRAPARSSVRTSQATMTMQAALAIDRVVRVWVTDEDDVVILDKTL